MKQAYLRRSIGGRTGHVGKQLRPCFNAGQIGIRVWQQAKVSEVQIFGFLLCKLLQGSIDSDRGVASVHNVPEFGCIIVVCVVCCLKALIACCRTFKGDKSISQRQVGFRNPWCAWIEDELGVIHRRVRVKGAVLYCVMYLLIEVKLCIICKMSTTKSST